MGRRMSSTSHPRDLRIVPQKEKLQRGKYAKDPCLSKVLTPVVTLTTSWMRVHLMCALEEMHLRRKTLQLTARQRRSAKRKATSEAINGQRAAAWMHFIQCSNAPNVCHCELLRSFTTIVRSGLIQNMALLFDE